MTTVLRFLGLALAACLLINMVAEAVSPLIPVLTVGLIVAAIVWAVFGRSRSS
jgi:hypothetical protein